MKQQNNGAIKQSKWYTRIGRASEIADPGDRRLYRLFEMLPGILSWGTLVTVTMLSWWAPVWIAIFIIAFDVYWLLKTIYFSVHLRSAFATVREHMNIHWRQRLEQTDPAPTSPVNVDRWQDIRHLVVFPMYNEPLEIIDASFQALVESDYPLDRMIVVLATERREKDHAQRVATIIQKRYGSLFDTFIVTSHPANQPGELAGKGSNETWALKHILPTIIDKRAIPYERVIVSVFDSDTRVEPQYFGCLTWHYLTCDHPTRSSFQPVPFYHNNIWDAPMLVRVVAASGTFWHTMKQGQPEDLATFSSHSMSLQTLVDVGFWQTNIVSEDSRIFWQSYIYFNGDYRVVPLYYPVKMDAVLAPSLWQSLKNLYKQQRRWAWGSENIPYMLFGFLKNKHIPFSAKFAKAARYIEGFWSWPTNALLIFLLGWLPLFLGGEAFNVTVLSANLPVVTRTLMSFAMLGLISSAVYFLIILPKRPSHHPRRRHLAMAWQWILLPFTIVVFGALPALDAQTRLLLGKYMGFWVTPKHKLGVDAQRAKERLSMPSISHLPAGQDE